MRFLQAIADVPPYLSKIRSGNYDAVVVNSSVAPVPLLSAYLARVPVLLIVRESLETNPMLKSAIPKSLIRRLLSKWATEVVCISDYVAGQFGFPSKVIYPQVGQEFIDFHPTSREPEPGQRRAVMFGTISPEKGQLDAVRAISDARNNGTDIHLEIYGQGTSRDNSNLLSAINEFDVADLVTVRGPTTDVLSAYNSCDVALVCSRNEGFGKVTAEAILTGRPVVAYGFGGTSEILAYGGGVCTKPSPHALGEALCEVFADDNLMSRLKDQAAASALREKLALSARQVIGTVEALAKTEG
jgi:glycosyltransferase involved in cell wall biosynthesis